MQEGLDATPHRRRNAGNWPVNARPVMEKVSRLKGVKGVKEMSTKHEAHRREAPGFACQMERLLDQFGGGNVVSNPRELMAVWSMSGSQQRREKRTARLSTGGPFTGVSPSIILGFDIA